MKKNVDTFLIVTIILSTLVVIFILFPLVTTIVTSGRDEIRQTLSDHEVLRSLGITFFAAFISMGLGLAGGIPLAYILSRKKFPGKTILEGIINLPLVIPHTAAGIALLMVFGRNGMFGKLFASIGIFFTDHIAGIVVAMLFVGIPFLINASRDAFDLIDPELELVAQTDGASNWQCFWFITLPNAWRAILSGLVMMGARGVSEFGAVAIIAYHPITVPVLIFERFQGFGLQSAQPIAAILIIISLAAFIVIRTLSAKKNGEDDRS